MWSQRKKQFSKNLTLFVIYGVILSLLRTFSASTHVRHLLPEMPSVMLDYGNRPIYNESKVALLIENRPMGMLAPLMIHFMSVVPPDWRFRFMGSDVSVEKINSSAAIRRHVKSGKLDLTYIPSNMSVGGQEQISHFLTNQWIMEQVLVPAEWLLVFQTDSIFCGKHKGSLDDWLEYDWVGAPWYEGSRFGGNGGLSLRRVSAMRRVIEYQQRESYSDPEDVWLTERLGHLPQSKTANGTESLKFSVESLWYDEPLGYHVGGSGAWLSRNIYGRPEQRKHIWNYCPEMKITLDMDTSVHMPHVCDNIF